MARPRKIELDEVRARAMAAFWRDGYEATSLAKLEEATGTGRRSLFNSFEDKLGLFKQSLADFRRHAAARYLAPVEAPGAGLAGIEETFRRLADDGATPDGKNGCLVCNTAREPIAHDPAVSEQIWLYFDRIEAAFRKALEEARGAGKIPPDADVGSRAKFLLGILVSLCTLARAGAPKETLDSIAAEALARLR